MCRYAAARASGSAPAFSRDAGAVHNALGKVDGCPAQRREWMVMSGAVRVKDLFELPEHLSKGAFVLKLAEGIEDPRTTAATYVVTPALAGAFDRALRVVGTALRDRRSAAAYLHGSFGAGKSHFMALLSLLLAGHEEAWRIPALHRLRAQHPFAGGKKLLELHFHMVDRASLESAIFTAYLAFVRAHHPDAPVPPLFGDDGLFELAESLRAELGDARFFAPLGEGAGARGGKEAVRWDRARFDAARTSADPAVRAELFSILVKKRFPGWEQASGAFADLDAGLGTLARHAGGLGYDGVVLFLDELIPWLAGRAADVAWLHREVQKLVKLVEASDLRRPIPVVSFIARQRDLAAMVGEPSAGAEDARLRESLQWMKERFEEIWLDDRNLPAIVEHRVLRPKEGARAQLAAAFEAMKRSAGASGGTLLGTEDAAAFQKLYPFSPALVDVLVALSSSLGRQRTAIELLMELLVEHIEDLAIGEVVRVGDLFDLLAAGEAPADGVMCARFESAKQIYRHLLPLIQEAHGTTTDARCQRRRAAHPARLGCAGCPEAPCRTDNRLAKALLVAALVPETPAVKDLTASRLVQLNHGSLAVPVAGAETGIVAQKLRRWAAVIGQVHVGLQADPAVSIRLEGVDTGPILERAAHADTPGARTRVIHDLLFEALGLDADAARGKDHKIDWRGTARRGQIVFGNVRTMGPEPLRCRDDHDWRLVIDDPFDDGTYGPNDDLAVLERLREDGGGAWTLVWLPSFFSAAATDLLGDLVRLEEILGSRDRAREYVHHLSVEDQGRALVDLENLRSMKRMRLLEVLGAAYGVARPEEGDLDPGRSIEQHLHLLKPGVRLEPCVAPHLAGAVNDHVDALLAARYPRHPRFTGRLTRKRVEQLVERFGELVDAPDGKIAADRALLEEMRGTLGELGLVRVTESAVHLLEDRTLQELEQRRLHHAVDAPNAGQVRRWIDEQGKLGLEDDALDLVARCYARHTARTFTRFGKPYPPAAGERIPDDVVLEKPALPDAAAWGAAFEAAGHLLGVTLPGRVRNADHLKRFESELAGKLGGLARAAAELPGRLAEWAALIGVDPGADRIVTARAGDALLAALRGQGAVAQVEALAAFPARTSPRAVGTSLASAPELVKVLGDAIVKGVFQQVVARRGTLAGAEDILGRAAEALRQDELHMKLGERLRALAEAGQRLLTLPARIVQGAVVEETLGHKPSAGTVIQRTAAGREAALAALEAAVRDARAEIERIGDRAEIEVDIVVHERRR